MNEHQDEPQRRGPRFGGMSRSQQARLNVPSKRVKKAYRDKWTVKQPNQREGTPRVKTPGAPSLREFARTQMGEIGQRWLQNK